MEALHGFTPDISPFMRFHFWEEVYYSVDNSYPSESPEKKGHFVGISTSVGDALTFQILTDDTNRIIHRSAVRAVNTSRPDRNLRLDPPGGETQKPIIQSFSDVSGDPSVSNAQTFKPEELLGMSYLKDPGEDGQRFRAHISAKITELDENNIEKIKFLVKCNEAEVDEILSYSELLDIVNKQIAIEQGDKDRLWRFKEIVAHEGPLQTSHPAYNGSPWNVQIMWEDGSTTTEPLSIIAADEPVVCAMYAKRNGLLDKPGWKRFKRLASREKKMLRMINQARLTSVRRTTVYKFGYRVPQGVKQAISLDKENGNSMWQDAIKLELSQLHAYDTFKDLGRGAAAPSGHKKIKVHYIFDVKNDGRHKARLVAGGHLTDAPLDSVYSGVVSLRSLRLVLFIAELNGLNLIQADVSSAYLYATTKEKVYIIGDVGFGDLKDHTLVIFKALYGLRSSGARWHEKFADSLRDDGWTPSKSDADVWMRQTGNLWEYICVYVDDVLGALICPNEFLDMLRNKCGYHLKGDGELHYHLGCDYGRDPDGTLYSTPKKYIERMIESYKEMFGDVPKPYTSPLEKNDHPEIDTSEELDALGIKKYQSLIGALQWLVSLGRFDVATAVMTMSRFRIAPRQGHLDRLKRVYGYVRKNKEGAIRMRTGIPDYSSIEHVQFDWMQSVYGNVVEEVPYDMPKALGKSVVTTTYVDANLYHDLLTGRSVTGVLHLINQTPIDWFTKRQATVETATYGSEFVAARQATEQVIDLRITLRYLGVPIEGPSFMFGDNQSVVTSSTIPHSNLNKRHNALSYHRVREAIASGVIRFHHMMGVGNPADVLSKHCGFQQFWPTVQPLLFWRGETREDNPT